jgi:bifunctional enzyme CysN/CysC
MAEREQGITIDVAYRYFTTEKRSFIVADTPGHEEYTRNMAVGASFADLAVILVDATHGVLVQTRRHTRICSMMGIEHFVFAVNKMDLIGYDQIRFEKITKDIKRMMAEYDYQTLRILPVSATEGDNITRTSSRMLWYRKESLLTYLENVVTDRPETGNSFLMPVQRVCRPDHTFRGFQGQIEAGQIRIGDTVTTLPSNEKAVISRIIDAGRSVQISETGHAVTLSLDREVDVSRGCVLTTDSHLCVGSLFSARLLWMDDTPLISGKNYYLKLGTRMIPAVVMRLNCKIDVNTGEEIPSDTTWKNEIVDCDISVSDRIVFDQFQNNHALGSLILIDRITNMTSACGVITRAIDRSDNLTWQNLDITREFRAQQKGQTPVTIWLTGLSGSGKSTIANALEKRLVASGRHTMILDGDNIRMGLNKNLGFTEEDRIENIRRIAEVSKLMNDAGLIAITSFISPYARDRQRAQEIIGADSFLEIYISTPLEECERRDVKGLYRRARAGEISHFTGISSPYEIPAHPKLTLDTSRLSPEECVDAILDLLHLS